MNVLQQDESPIYVTAGADEWVTVTLTETTGQTLVGTTLALQFTPAGAAAPTSWLATVVVSVVLSVAVVRAKMNATTAPEPGTYDVWVRVIDPASTETVIRLLPRAAQAA